MIPIDTIGSGETILAVHGGPGTDHRLFRPELDRLSAFSRVVYFDLPGHGRSDDPADFKLGTMAESLEAVRTAAGAERVTLLGSSYGGFVSLAYALAHPDRVARLILADTAASNGFREESKTIARERADAPMLAAFERVWSDALAGDAEFGRDMRTLFPLYFRRSNREAVDAFALRTSYRAAPRKAIISAFGTYDLRPHLRNLTMPALVAFGTYDWITPPSQSREMAGLLPNSQLVEFEDSGHYPFLDEPERFATVVKEFLADTAVTA